CIARVFMGKHSDTLQAPADPAPVAIAVPRTTAMHLLVDVARHALPLLSLYFLHGSIASFLVLTAFNLSLGLMFVVGTTRDAVDVTTVDPRSRWLVMRAISVVVVAAFLAFIAAFIMIPIVMPALMLGWSSGIEWTTVLNQKDLLVPIAGMALLAAVRYQELFEERTTLGDQGAPSRKLPVVGNLQQDRRQSLAAYAAQVTLIATYVAVCFLLIEFGGWGLYAFPPLYTAMLVFYDARPDIGERIFPQLWQRK
ncbi:MAG: hypothetical protein ABI451_03160, partial [Dokdonella sp.]